MAKRKSSAKSRSRVGRKAIPSPGKVRLELRFDHDVFDQIQRVADKAEISVNQLMQGLARWAGPQLQVGEPYNDTGVVAIRPVPGVVFVGRGGGTGDADAFGDDMEEYYRGEVVFVMDFTERRVIRDDLQFPGKPKEAKS